jgi:hypothetical protein
MTAIAYAVVAGLGVIGLGLEVMAFRAARRRS